MSKRKLLLADDSITIQKVVNLTFADEGFDVVVVDNGGGGIFSFLPQATSLPGDRFEQLFGTPQSVDLVALAGAHGLPATVVSAADEVRPAVSSSLARGGVGVVIVRTDRAANVRVHDELHAAVAATLG